ncbi:MAG: hypothetical protein A2W90_00530 [Bacteroidetes bacterium GWF2_42_66]|nr:MAG: hypothetical protein A2W92_21635 [Bacteroidetes bacterium GWA2_42_15]OFY02107.1 MAG: hypothetical protein A2W89_11715 [Bacteroidetes bacterium GWE2_42_39]OFY43453.1 MAG: hypothetical protein A2W90_00530 [Bacteroidetes bacterium GWF2_42_66]HBL76540.1 hypothetical protein [Prolixibacteraceae bacterium]HCR91629.1 hypothetical protein [Prolixibacteraceae bacterium]
MQEIGYQYSKDDKTDPSNFLKRARLHQSVFRAEYLDLPFDTYGNYLTKEDGEKGKNFYNGFGIFDAVKKYRKYNKPLYSNMLRSEHIPFNFFIPLDKNKEYCKNIFADILKLRIVSIDKIEIEYAPKPKEKYLNDGTSFDAYIEYSNYDGRKGMIGIEVKYTEKEYKLQANSKQEKDVNDKSSAYYSVTEKCGLYKINAIKVLLTDNFRQVWRNHILGESILLADSNKFKYFTSLTLFPADNAHFIKTSKKYTELLKKNDNNFIALTYEDFFALLRKYCPDNNYENWLNYLTTRYIVTIK